MISNKSLLKHWIYSWFGLFSDKKDCWADGGFPLLVTKAESNLFHHEEQNEDS